jgi:cobalt-zinc-cadmium efflux system outer membrane protein
MSKRHIPPRVLKKPSGARYFLGAAFLGAVFGTTKLVRAAPPTGERAGIERVCTSGPESGVARAQRLRGVAATTAAGLLPNPTVVAEHQRSLSGPSESETTLGISVPIGIGGRRGILRDAAALRRQQAVLEAQATLFDSALVFREAYVVAALDRARVVVLTEQQTALDALSVTIQALARAGETAGYDLLRQRVHARVHRRRLDSAKARAQASQALIEAWLGTSVDLPPASELTTSSTGERPFTDELAPNHPRLRGLEAEAGASNLEGRAARRKWVPDLEIFAGYRGTTFAGNTGHGIALGLRLPLTFFDHGQGEAEHADAAQALARSTADSLRRQHGAQFKSAYVELGVLSASLGEAVTAAAEAVTLQQKARLLYAAGETSITELLEAFGAAEEARLSLLVLAEEIAGARLSMMRAAGTQFDVALDRICTASAGATR